MPSIITRSVSTFPLFVRTEGQVLTVHATRRRAILTVVLSKVEATRPRAIPMWAWRYETPRPVRTLDLGTITTRKEERPGFWRRVKEWLLGRGRSEPLEPVRTTATRPSAR